MHVNQRDKNFFNFVAKRPWVGTVWMKVTSHLMAQRGTWVSAQKIEELLGIDRKTLFKYRDNGTFKLGMHFAAFPETRSRDSYRWNLKTVKQQLESMQLQAVSC